MWRLVGFPPGFTDHGTTLLDKLKLFFTYLNDEHIPQEHRLLTVWIVWRLWKCWNGTLFNTKAYSPFDIVTKAREDAHEWISSTRAPNIISPTTTPRSPSIRSQWRPPTTGWIKCNYDVSHHEGAVHSGMGWIICNQQGILLQAGRVNLKEGHR